MINFDAFLHALFGTLRDVVPIIVIIIAFQTFVIRKRVPHLKRVLIGFVYVVLGMTLFLEGLETALFPIGKLMAEQLTDPVFVHGSIGPFADALRWQNFKWVYLFAATIGFATTIAEPALIAVATKAKEVSAGAITVWGLRIAVAVGVAIGVALGSFRIIAGIPLHYFILSGYVIVVVQTLFAPRLIIALAYDSGGVTTSTVTVPVIAALGLGLATTVPGRSPLIDGFGLIAHASLFPIMSVMGYAQLVEWRLKRRTATAKGGDT
ncbi:MAG TPA: DUF1538 domain-containing protein [Acidiferrobacteraceae bacterium]|nr:DUF1538 domain-containing protein [Acidiferrobacteraceae bacterium]